MQTENVGRHLKASGWCCNNTHCPSPVGCPVVCGGRGGEVCRACATDAADIALFDDAADVVAFADPEDPNKPLCEFVRNGAVGPVRGFAHIFDKRQKAVLYRVSLSDGPDAAVSVELTKLRSDSGDREARSYRVMCSTGGEIALCECRGALRWGKPCKHAKSLRQWVRAGLI